jgi:arylformamidase
MCAPRIHVIGYSDYLSGMYDPVLKRRSGRYLIIPFLKNADMNQWIDVTQTLQEGMIHWPGDTPPQFRRSAALAKGDMVNATRININAHTGTHMDAPLHFLEGTADMTEIPVEAMTGGAKVFEVATGKNITAQDIMAAEKRVGKIAEKDKIIFRTHLSGRDWIKEDFHYDYPALTSDAAQYLADKKIILTGIDYLSVAPYDNLTEVHEILLKNQIWIIEGLKLSEITEGLYEIIAAPLKIQGADGSPARVLLKKLN